MTSSYNFPRSARLVQSSQFGRVYRSGLRCKYFPLYVRALPREDGESRLGLAIGRKTGKAVVRNRWKRAIREAFRLNRHRLNRPHDLVIAVDWNATEEHIHRVEDTFLELVEYLNDRNDAGEG